MSQNKIVIRDAQVVSDGRMERKSVLIANGRISQLIADGQPVPEADEVVEAQDLVLMSGAIDDHVHFRDPGLTHKATMRSESAAAVAGGVTSVMDMPNTVPQTTTLEAWNAKMQQAQSDMLTNYAFYLGATNANSEELLRADYERVCGIKVFMGSSTGGMLVDNAQSLRKIFAEAPTLIAAHCEQEDIIKTNSQKAKERYGDRVPWNEHCAIRSAEACYASSSMAVQMARETGARLHIMHITSARELSLLDAGPIRRITGEVCPTHLWFSREDYDRLGPLVKCNPSVKTTEDREALRRALAEGLLTTVGTDHAPHTLEEKLGAEGKALYHNALSKLGNGGIGIRLNTESIGTDYWHAPSGMPMIEFSVPMMLTLSDMGYWDVATVAQRMAEDVADLYGIEDRGKIREGFWADLTLVSHKPRRVESVRSLCGWSPLAGTELTWQVERTYVSGHLAYANNHVVGHDESANRGMAMRFMR